MLPLHARRRRRGKESVVATLESATTSRYNGILLVSLLSE